MRSNLEKIVCGVAITGALCLCRTMLAANVTWTNSSGGNWSNPANWDSGSVPGSSDNALIVNGGSFTVNVDVDAAVGSLTLGGASGTQTVSISSHTLTLNGNSLVNGNGVVALSSGTLAGNGTLTNQG